MNCRTCGVEGALGRKGVGQYNGREVMGWGVQSMTMFCQQNPDNPDKQNIDSSHGRVVCAEHKQNTNNSHCHFVHAEHRQFSRSCCVCRTQAEHSQFSLSFCACRTQLGGDVDMSISGADDSVW